MVKLDKENDAIKGKEGGGDGSSTSACIAKAYLFSCV